MKRFFVTNELGKDFELSGQEHTHLSQVMRMQIGERVIVCRGDENDYMYEIVSISKQRTALKFIEQKVNTANPKSNLTVFLAVIKPDLVSLVVQKLNEIGATELVLYNAERCNVALRSVRLEKLQSIAEQSCKQCGRSLPLRVSVTTEEPDKALSKFDKIFWADETVSRDDIYKTNEIAVTKGETVAIVIGPEGGFTANEQNKMRAIGNVKPVSLGKRILRAETASIVLASLVLSKMGEL